MELPSKPLEQGAFNTGPKIKEHMLIFLDKSTHEEHLSQPLQSNTKHFKIAITFLTGYNGIFSVRKSNINFFSRNQLLIKMVVYKILYQHALTKLRV